MAPKRAAEKAPGVGGGAQVSQQTLAGEQVRRRERVVLSVVF